MKQPKRTKAWPLNCIDLQSPLRQKLQPSGSQETLGWHWHISLDCIRKPQTGLNTQRTALSWEIRQCGSSTVIQLLLPSEGQSEYKPSLLAAASHAPQQLSLSLSCTPTPVLNKFYLPKCRCPAACMGSLRSGWCRSMSELQLRKTRNKEPLGTEQHVSNTLWPTGLQAAAQRTPKGVFAVRKDKMRPGQGLWTAVCTEGLQHDLDKVDCIVDENRKWMKVFGNILTHRIWEEKFCSSRH